MLLIEGLGSHLVHIYSIVSLYGFPMVSIVSSNPTADSQIYVLGLEKCYIIPREKAHLVDTTFLFDLPLAGK